MFEAYRAAVREIRNTDDGVAVVYADHYPVLLEPDRRLYLDGDHLTNMNAWMNGAFESARHVATAIHARVGRGSPQRKSAASQTDP
jgi:hypothetical protein